MTKIQQRSLPKRYLILCEGDSEVLYFKSLRIDEDYRDKLRGVDIEIYKPSDHSPVGLVKEAKKKFKEEKKGIPYEGVFVVFDRDGHANIAQAFEEARTANIPIYIILSAVCFEYWYILHFVQVKQTFLNGDALIKYLKGKCLDSYQKNSVTFQHLKKQVPQALENASWLEKINKADLDRGARIYELDTYTDVHKLVLHLITLE